MAALQNPRLTKERNPRIRRLPVAAATQIFEGAMVAISGIVAVPAATSTTLRVLGVAATNVDNRLGAAGAQTIDVLRGCWCFDIDATDPVTTADIGNPGYATDDHTVARTNGANTKVQAGIIFDVDQSGVWIMFS